MKRRIYEKSSPLSTLLEWLITLTVTIFLVRMVLGYLYQHLGIVIAVVIFILGGILGYRIWDYRRRTRF